MTDAEREMLTTIHLYGLIFSLDDRGKEAALKGIKTILKGEQP